MVQSDVSDQLLSCSQQVALGMQYLSTKAFVHRDLAARNVFVTRELVCKVSLFLHIGYLKKKKITNNRTHRSVILDCHVTWTMKTTMFHMVGQSL